MNMSDNERFHELAHKVLANAAEPAERAQLQALIAENPPLKKEFSQLGKEAEAAREILMLMEDIDVGYDPHQEPSMPPPMERLRTAVQEVFEPGSTMSVGRVQGRVGRSLQILEHWAGRQVGAGQKEVLDSIASLRRAFMAMSRPRELQAEATLSRGKAFIQSHETLLHSRPEQRVISKGSVQARGRRGREAELMPRLVALERRIRDIEATARDCRQELSELLGEMAEETRSLFSDETAED